jgi:hypothetical protein
LLKILFFSVFSATKITVSCPESIETKQVLETRSNALLHVNKVKNSLERAQFFADKPFIERENIVINGVSMQPPESLLKGVLENNILTIYGDGSRSLWLNCIYQKTKLELVFEIPRAKSCRESKNKGNYVCEVSTS